MEEGKLVEATVVIVIVAGGIEGKGCCEFLSPKYNHNNKVTLNPTFCLHELTLWQAKENKVVS